MNKLMYASAGAAGMLFVAIFVSTPGCAPDKNATTTSSADSALHDPMGYNESVPTPDSISNGNMKKDLNDVFNP